MRERPILFSAPMVRAILDGSKTQTRRMVKPQPSDSAHTAGGDGTPMQSWWETGKDINWCPYGRPCDRLWVRETWGLHDQGFDTAEESTFPIYRADSFPPAPKRWRPSIHMPRALSRITLEVTGVRVERLQRISEADAIAEGVQRIRIGDGYDDMYSATARSWADAIEQRPDVQDTAGAAYRELWESINGLGSWLANPWVWVVEFKRLP